MTQPIAVVQIRKEPVYRREAFEKGLKRLGYTLVREGQPRSRDDLLVIWNKKRGTEEKAAGDWERRGGTVIVAENGYLQKVDKTTYAISTHGHNGSGWFPVGADDRFTKLGFEVKPWRVGHGSEIIVRDQRGIGSVLMASPPGWGAKTIAELKRVCSLPVRLIPHPGNFAPRVPVEQDMRNASAFVTWCSAMGVRALVEGIPCFYAAPHWIVEDAAWPVRGFSQPPYTPTNNARGIALRRMSHGQWHFEEIATGEPFARMRAAGWGPTKWA